jgi:uncharacterized protein (DUF362 family)
LGRRQFLKAGVGVTAAVVVPSFLHVSCDAGGSDATPTVHAVVGDDLAGLYDMGFQAARAAGIRGTALAEATVFIKPNLVALGMEMFGCGYDPSTGECTKPEIVAGVAEACLQAGAAKVTIGEGSQTDTWNWQDIVFLPGTVIDGTTNLGDFVAALNARYGEGRADLVCLHEADLWDAIPSSSTADDLADGIFVGQAFARADHVISVPVIKTHQWALMSGAMKNLFGVASMHIHGNGISRCRLHTGYDGVPCHGIDDAGVSGAFVDIVKWRREQGFRDFAIVDGSIGLEGSGPHKAPVNDGRTIHLKDRNAAGRYFVLGCDDLVAADAMIAALINIPWTDVKALQMAQFLGLGAVEDVVLAGATVEELRIADWARPEIRPESYFSGICPA